MNINTILEKKENLNSSEELVSAMTLDDLNLNSGDNKPLNDVSVSKSLQESVLVNGSSPFKEVDLINEINEEVDAEVIANGDQASNKNVSEVEENFTENKCSSISNDAPLSPIISDINKLTVQEHKNDSVCLITNGNLKNTDKPFESTAEDSDIEEISMPLTGFSKKNDFDLSCDSFSLLLSACSLNEREGSHSRSPDSELTQIESDIKKIEEILSKSDHLDLSSNDSSLNAGLQEILKTTSKGWPISMDDESLLGLAQSVSSEIEKNLCPGSSGLENIVSAAVNEIALEYYKDNKMKDQLSNDSDSNMVTASDGVVSSCSPLTSSDTSQQYAESLISSSSLFCNENGLNLKLDEGQTSENGSESASAVTSSNVDQDLKIQSVEDGELGSSFSKSDVLGYEENGTVLLGAWNELRASLRQLHRSVVPSTLTNSGLMNPRNRPSINRIKVLANLLLADDPHQLFTRVNQLSQELCIELKVRLLATIYDKPEFDEACTFIQSLCESYEWVINVCEAIQGAFEKLDSDHLSRFGLNWMTVNMHTFYSVIFTDPDVQDYLDICTAKAEEFVKGKEIISCLVSLKRTLSVAEGVWVRAESSLQEYNMERAALNAHKRQLYSGWSQFKNPPKCSTCHIGTQKKGTTANSETGSSDVPSRGAQSQCPCSDCTKKEALLDKATASSSTESSGGSCECHFCNSSPTSQNVSNSMLTVSSGNVLPPISQPQLSLYPHIHGTSSDITSNQGFETMGSIPNATKSPMFANPFLGSDLLTEQLIKEWDLAYGDALSPPNTHPTSSTASSGLNSECLDKSVKTSEPSCSNNDCNGAASALSDRPKPSTGATINCKNLVPQTNKSNTTKVRRKTKSYTRTSSRDSPSDVDSSVGDDWSSGNESDVSSCVSSNHGDSHNCDCCYCHMLQNMPGGGRQNYNDRRERLLKRLFHKKKKTSCHSSNSSGAASENCMGEQTLDEIMNFIEGRRPTSKCLKKVAKKQRQKDRKLALKKQQREREEENDEDTEYFVDTDEDEDGPLAELRRRAPDVTITVVKQNQQNQTSTSSTMNNSSNKHPLATKPAVSNTWVPPKPLASQMSSKPPSQMGMPSMGGKTDLSNNQFPPSAARKDASLAPPGGLSSLLKGMKKEDKDGKGSQMVTIRRVMDPVSSEPTVTITLKGEEPDKDKVLFKLVNGQACQENAKKQAKKAASKVKKTPVAMQVYDIPEGIDPEEGLKLKRRMKRERQKQRKEEEKVEEEKKEEQKHLELKKQQEFLKQQEAQIRKQQAALQKQQQQLLNPKNIPKTKKKSSKAATKASVVVKEKDNVASNFSLPPGVSINKVVGQPGMVTISNNMGNPMGQPFLPNPNMFASPVMQNYGMGNNYSMFPPSMMDFPGDNNNGSSLKENVIVVDTKPTKNEKSKGNKNQVGVPTSSMPSSSGKSKKKKISFETMTPEEKIDAAIKGVVSVDLLSVSQRKKYKLALKNAVAQQELKEVKSKNANNNSKMNQKVELSKMDFTKKSKSAGGKPNQKEKTIPVHQTLTKNKENGKKIKETIVIKTQETSTKPQTRGTKISPEIQKRIHKELQQQKKDTIQGDKKSKKSTVVPQQQQKQQPPKRTNAKLNPKTNKDEIHVDKVDKSSDSYNEARYAQYLAANATALANMSPADKKRSKKKGKNGRQVEDLTTIDSVFTPKDVPGGELDDETDREVEAFKRFCLYNVPRNSGEKPKVNFNVKDIMFKKKR